MKQALILITFLSSFLTMNAQNQDPWTQYLTPSSTHKLFSQYEGNFKMEITMQMGENQKPAVIEVQSEHNMLLGGRFLEMKQTGNMMGMDYQAITILGYNNTDKKVTLTTITNMGTGTLFLVGDWDENTKYATLFGKLTNPVTKNTINLKQIVTFVDENTLLIESFDQEGENPEKKTVQYKLVREVEPKK